MALQATESCVLIGSPRAKLMVVKWFNSHFCPPTGSADLFIEIANRRVKAGLKLESECGD